MEFTGFDQLFRPLNRSIELFLIFFYITHMRIVRNGRYALATLKRIQLNSNKWGFTVGLTVALNLYQLDVNGHDYTICKTLFLGVEKKSFCVKRKKMKL